MALGPRWLAGALVTFSACPTTIVSGDGTLVSEARQVGAFTRVDIESAITALITTGPRSVTVRTDQNLQALVETLVEGDALVVRVKANTSITNHGALEATIANDVLEGVATSGAAKVTSAATATSTFTVDASGASTVSVSGISASALSASASGSSRVTLSGAAASASIVGSGASTLDLKAVPLTSASLELSGASSARAMVSSSLTGTVSGASTATITGTPSSTVSVTGDSSLHTGAP